MAATTSGSVVSVDPQVVSGAPVFRGTRVPIQNLFDYLASGEPLDDFLEGFPGVTREMAVAAIDEAAQALAERHLAHPA